MTIYNPPTDAELTAEKGITQDKMRRMRDISIAQFEGATGAPRLQSAAMADNAVTAAKIATGAVGTSEIATNAVGNAEIASSAVRRGNIYFATASQSVSVPAEGYANLVPTGGLYADHVYVGDANQNRIRWRPHTSTYSSTLRFYNDYYEGSAVTAYCYHAYPVASPPYDLGDGEIGHFIFSLLEKGTGKIMGLSEAVDAPWHNNGPTNCSADFYDKQGRGWRNRKRLADDTLILKPTIDSIRLKLLKGEQVTHSEADLIRDYVKAFSGSPTEPELITQEIKQADMALIPHPWPDYDATTQEVVLLDPVIDMTHDLSQAAKDYDDLNIIELFESGALVITNTEVNRAGPPGVKVVDYGWKSGAGIVT